MAEERYVLIKKMGGGACSGPQHGVRNTIPRGDRFWKAGEALSLTQQSDAGMTHNVFCGAACFCDWHGYYEAALESAGSEDDPPGRFTLCWIAQGGTTVGAYMDWEELSVQIGKFQQGLIEQGLI